MNYIERIILRHCPSTNSKFSTYADVDSTPCSSSEVRKEMVRCVMRNLMASIGQKIIDIDIDNDIANDGEVFFKFVVNIVDEPRIGRNDLKRIRITAYEYAPEPPYLIPIFKN